MTFKHFFTNDENERWKNERSKIDRFIEDHVGIRLPLERFKIVAEQELGEYLWKKYGPEIIINVYCD